MTKYLPILLAASLPYITRFILYSAALKIRKIESTILNRLIIAGAQFLLMAIPISLPVFAALILMFAAPMIALHQLTETDLFPEAFGIAVVVESLSIFATDYLLTPFIQSL